MIPAPFPPVDGTEPCRTGDQERFFPRSHAGRQVVTECRGCHIREQCADFAVTHVVTGVWGGTTEVGREGPRRSLGIVPVNLDETRTRRLAS